MHHIFYQIQMNRENRISDSCQPIPSLSDRAMIKVLEVEKRFNSNLVLNRVSFEIPAGKLLVVLGPSGAGKTVLLKIVAGIIKPDSGEVFFDGRPISSEYSIYEIRKELGFVFQTAALFDSLTIEENIGLALEVHSNLPRRAIHNRIKEILEIIKLSGKGSLYPNQISFGMKKLVAIGRAIALNPKYLFYDEPTTGLDPITKDRIVRLIIDLKSQFKTTGILVTHDLETAKSTSDTILFLRAGRLESLKGEAIEVNDYA